MPRCAANLVRNALSQRWLLLLARGLVALPLSRLNLLRLAMLPALAAGRVPTVLPRTPGDCLRRDVALLGKRRRSKDRLDLGLSEPGGGKRQRSN